MKQNSEIRIKCTTEQLDRIKRDANRIGMTIREYALGILLNSEIDISVKSR